MRAGYSHFQSWKGTQDLWVILLFSTQLPLKVYTYLIGIAIFENVYVACSGTGQDTSRPACLLLMENHKEIDKYIAYCQELGAKGMAWMRVTKEGLESNIAKFLNLSTFQGNNIETNKASGVKLMFLNRILVNRNHFIRRILRNFSPAALKSWFFNSRIIENIKQANKREKANYKLSDEDRNIVGKYFVDDLKKLKQEFHITF